MVDSEAKKRLAAMPPEKAAVVKFGPLNPAMVCPHCQTTGRVHSKQVVNKAGISGGKAAGAVLTGGASLLVTGISRTAYVTQAHCEACNNTWSF